MWNHQICGYGYKIYEFLIKKQNILIIYYMWNNAKTRTVASQYGSEGWNKQTIVNRNKKFEQETVDIRKDMIKQLVWRTEPCAAQTLCTFHYLMKIFVNFFAKCLHDILWTNFSKTFRYYTANFTSRYSDLKSKQWEFFNLF